MPVAGADGLTVLDFGCGPAYDLVGLAPQSRPRRLIGIDVSQASLAEAKTDTCYTAPNLNCSTTTCCKRHFRSRMHSTIACTVPAHCTKCQRLTRVERITTGFRAGGGRAQFMVYHTDGLWLRRDALMELVSACGFEFEWFGVAVSAWEMSPLHKRYAAIMGPRVPQVSRELLADLTTDERRLPLTRENVHADINGALRRPFE
jgi:hypothetical protein